MINELIGPRRENWRAGQYDSGPYTRSLRQWRQQIGYGQSWMGNPEIYGYGAARFMSSTIREEIIKCFEQYVHMTSGLGETMQHEIVARYFRAHPDRRYIETEYRPIKSATPNMSPYSDARAIPKHRLPK